MGFRLPEKPVLFYPSLARQIGTDEALLYAIYADRLEARGEQDSHGNLSLCLDRNDWLRLADFWNETRLANVTRSLVNHGYIQATSGDARITLTLLPQLPDSVCEELPIVEPLTEAREEPVVPVLDVREPVSEPIAEPVAEEEPPVLYQQADAEYMPQFADDPYYATPSAPPVTVQKLPVMEQPPAGMICVSCVSIRKFSRRIADLRQPLAAALVGQKPSSTGCW
ncbi:hypothetical protein [Aliamphritea spongicola]|nr:hypothetical protein [Aliamphritea spongicola]